MIAQLPLALRWPRRQRFEHFHSGANAVAVAAVRMSLGPLTTPEGVERVASLFPALITKARRLSGVAS